MLQYERYVWIGACFALLVVAGFFGIHCVFLNGQISVLDAQCTPRAEVSESLKISERLLAIDETCVNAGIVERSTNWRKFLIPDPSVEADHDDGKVRNGSSIGSGSSVRLVHAEAGHH